MENAFCSTQSLLKTNTVPDQEMRFTKRTVLLPCVILVCLSTMASAAEPTIRQLYSFACPTQQFTTCSEGYAPNVLIQASDGNFYGAAQLTTIGTSNPHGGTLFKIEPSGHFTLLFTFTADTNGNYLNGDNPATSLVEANDGFLYGTTFEGGATNNGVLFRIGKNGQNFEVVHNFCSAANCADGNLPGVVILGQDGHLYGTTAFGGSSVNSCDGGCGTIFRFTPPSTFKTLLALDGQAALPGGLVQGTDGNLYGTAGAQIFRFNLSGRFTSLVAFPPVNGFLPTSADSGLFQASNGKLYGAVITYSINQAQFYDLNPSGKGFHEFPIVGTLSDDFSIATPIQASDGNLWTAFTQRSGSTNGSVLAFSPTTGAVVHNFDFDGINGAIPEASVVQGADGRLYGTASQGGVVSGNQQAIGTVWVLDAGLRPPASAVAAFTPTSGVIASTVLIRGNHFVGTSAVAFNGASAAFTVLNAHFISATVPEGATTGPIAVTNPAGTTISVTHFTVP
jgi:uncharacterized repeat protein (TIGR03803 family)